MAGCCVSGFRDVFDGVVLIADWSVSSEALFMRYKLIGTLFIHILNHGNEI